MVDEGDVLPLVFTQEDNEVTEGEVFFTRAEHSPFFCTNSHKIYLTASAGEGSVQMQKEKPLNWVKRKECWVMVPGNEKQH